VNPKTRQQIALQSTAFFATLVLVAPYFLLRGQSLPWAAITLTTALLAGFVAYRLRHPWWWILIHTCFAPLLWLALQLKIAPIWYLGAFTLSYLVFRGAALDRVPLYLSNRRVADVLLRHGSAAEAKRLADLGAGIGSLLLPLHRLRPDLQLIGIENAPLSWLLGRLRCAGKPGIDWRFGDLWRISLNDIDITYAFLSPEPMSAVWAKATSEMRPGSLFISNSFPVPDTEPLESLEISEGSTQVLYIYRIPCR
jgi:hypothetical protein